MKAEVVIVALLTFLSVQSNILKHSVSSRATVAGQSRGLLEASPRAAKLNEGDS